MPMYVRVKDVGTGHEFDVPETDPRIGTALRLVDQERWPPTYQRRPPKHHVDLAEQPAPRHNAPRRAARTITPKEQS